MLVNLINISNSLPFINTLINVNDLPIDEKWRYMGLAGPLDLPPPPRPFFWFTPVPPISEKKNGKEFYIYHDQMSMVEMAASGKRPFHNTSEFVGREFKDWSDVKVKANQPWKEGIEIVEEMLKELGETELPEPIDHRRRVRFSEWEGDEVDIDRLRSGQEYWRTSKRLVNAGPEVTTIFVDITANRHQKSKDILWRGAGALIMAQKLEAAGYRTEIYAVEGGRGVWRDPDGSATDEEIIIGLQLKKAGDQLDISSLVNGVSGWFLRTVFFALLEHHCGDRPISPRLGYAVTPNQNDLDIISNNPSRIYMAGVFSKSKAIDVVRDELEKFLKEHQR